MVVGLVTDSVHSHPPYGLPAWSVPTVRHSPDGRAVVETVRACTSTESVARAKAVVLQVRTPPSSAPRDVARAARTRRR